MQEFMQSEKVSDLIKFRLMITPVIIQVLFWVGVVVSLLFGLGIMATSFGRYGGGGIQFLAGFFTMIFGPVLVRIYCELLILFFRMNETLTEIKNGMVKKK